MSILCVVAIIAGSLTFANIKGKKQIRVCRGNQIDMTKMLQYGEEVNDIEIVDRLGQLFDLDSFRNKPVLFLFVKDDIKNIRSFNDSLRRHLGDYNERGLNTVFINIGQNKEDAKISKQNDLTVYYDTDSLSLFKSFKVFNHGSNLILNKNHRVVLSTVNVLSPIELAKIMRFKARDIFLD